MRKEIMQSLLELPNQVRKALELDQQMLALAAELKEEQSLLLFGRGYNYATALEGALKVIRASKTSGGEVECRTHDGWDRVFSPRHESDIHLDRRLTATLEA